MPGLRNESKSETYRLLCDEACSNDARPGRIQLDRYSPTLWRSIIIEICMRVSHVPYVECLISIAASGKTLLVGIRQAVAQQAHTVGDSGLDKRQGRIGPFGPRIDTVFPVVC